MASASAGESGQTEKIISQFLLKTLHVVLDSRVPLLHGGAAANRPPCDRVRPKKRDQWFNLALGDPPAALESLGFWHRSVADPMVIDVLLSCDANADLTEAVIERWTVHYDPSPSSFSSTPPSSSFSTLRSTSQFAEAAAAFYKRTYKKSIVLIRSLYATLRLLPAYKAFRMLSSAAAASQHYNFNLTYRVSSFAEPFSRAEEEEMKHHHFTPVETQFGHLAVSVFYRPDLSVFKLEASSLIPPRIISDYVGSPAADPMRMFPSSLPSSSRGVYPSFPSRAVMRTSSGSNVPFTRPHSWTSPPLAHHPLSVSPSTASESRTSPSEVYGHRVASGRRPTAHGQGSSSLEEFHLSPPFSPSPTPSPPTHCSSPLQSRLRSETAPVSIPVPLTGRNLIHDRAPNFSDPTRNFLPPPSPRSIRVDPSPQESPSESRSFRKSEGFRIGELYPSLPGNTFQRGFKDGKDDSGRFSGLLSAGGSPRVEFSRSSSRLSLQDDLDDCGFSCPFAVDDVDPSDSQTRNQAVKEASETAQILMSSHKSQDAAVGELVHMLKRAGPLRQDPSYLSKSSKSGFDGEGSTSFFGSRKTADALEELQSYKEMKDILLSQSRSQLLGSTKRRSE